MKPQLIYITCPHKGEARTIGRALVEQRLAACANIIDGLDSIYWWDGTIHDESEALLIVKTKESLVQELIEEVKRLHSYSVPCIVAIPIEHGNPDFIDWIMKETK